MIKHRIVDMEKELHRKPMEPIITEAVDNGDLTPRQRKHPAEALSKNTFTRQPTMQWEQGKK